MGFVRACPTFSSPLLRVLLGLVNMSPLFLLFINLKFLKKEGKRKPYMRAIYLDSGLSWQPKQGKVILLTKRRQNTKEASVEEE